MSAHVWDRMSSYIDRELPPSERAGVEAHLRDCPDCARAVDELQAVDELARRQGVEAPAGYFEGLPGRLRARLAPRVRSRIPAWALALAAGLVLAVITPLTVRDRVTPAPEPRALSTAPAASLASNKPAVPAAEERQAPSFEGRAAARLADRARADEPADREGAAAHRLSRQERAGGVVASNAPVQGLETKATERKAAESFAGQREPRPRAAAAPAAPSAAADTVEVRDEEEEEATPLVSDDAGPERDAAGRPPAAPPARPGLAKSRPGADARFQSLSSRSARSAAEARDLRDAWQAFARDDPEGPHADDAFVRALEAGAAAWRLGGRREDRELVERDARAYLRRPEAAQKERVRALLAGLEP